MEFNSKEFDKLFSDKLENWQDHSLKSDWEMMSSMLDDNGIGESDYKTENEDFDANISKSLSNLNIEKAPQWTSLAAVLNIADATSDFDQQISQALNQDNNLSPDWSAFKEKFDAVNEFDLELDNNLIDKKSKANLSNIQAQYEEEDWKVLNQKIDERISLRYRIVKFKVLEIAVVILFIFTLFNVLQNQKIGDSTIVEKIKSIKFEAISLLDDFRNETPQVVSQNENNPLSEIDHIDYLEIITATNSEIIDNVQNSNNGLEIENHTIYEGKRLDYSPKPLFGLEKLIFNMPTDKQKLKQHFKKSEVSEIVALNSLSPNEVLSKTEIGILKQHQATENKETKSNKNLRMAMYTSTNIYSVHSPFDGFFATNPTIVYGEDIGGGVSFDFQHKRLHFLLGGAYTPKYYTPDIDAHTFGSFFTAYVTEDFSGIQLDVLQVPLEFRYDFIQKLKWRMYSVSGMSANIVLNSAYQIATDFVAFEDTQFGDVRNLRNENSHILKKDLEPGIIEGGQLPENLFITTQLGLGVERFLTPRWSIYFEPIYYHQISKNGIGPNDNSFKTLSLQIGAKTTIFGN